MTDKTLTQLLEAIIDGAEQFRVPAEHQLELVEQTSFPQYITALSDEFADATKNVATRVLAGTMIKNAIVGKSSEFSDIMSNRWCSLAADVRNNVRNKVLNTLNTQEKIIRSMAAAASAAIATVEVPKHLWDNIVELLTQGIDSAPSSYLKQAAFETLGLVCEAIPEQLAEKSHQVLNCISRGMGDHELDPDIRLSACVALLNALVFVKSNMDIDVQREIILNMVIKSCEFSSEKVRVTAFMCLVGIGELYYPLIGDYIIGIFNLTGSAMAKYIQNQESDDVCKQAVEFWSVICQNEISEPDQSRHYGEKALSHLAPIIQQLMCKQSEVLDDLEWDVAKAAGTCLLLFASNCPEECFKHVLPFVINNINNENWRIRDAAELSLGSLLEGVSEQLLPLIKDLLPILIENMKYPHSDIVRDTSTWTIGRIASELPIALPPDYINTIMNNCLVLFNDEPCIARRACWVVHNIANAIVQGDFPPEYSVSFDPYFGVLQHMIKAADRDDDENLNLMITAYEAINMVILSLGEGQFPQIIAQLPNFITKLKQNFFLQGLSSMDRRKRLELVSLLIGTLQTIAQKVRHQLGQSADELLSIFLQVLGSPEYSETHDDAMMAVGQIAVDCLGERFAVYMPMFKPHLFAALQNTQASGVLSSAVGVIADLSHALNNELAPYAQDLMQLVLQRLDDNEVDRMVKPQLINCLGDIALALGNQYARYVNFAFDSMFKAAAVRLEDTDQDDDDVDWLNEMRTAICDSMIGILHGLGHQLAIQFVSPQLSTWIQFIQFVLTDNITDDEVLLTLLRLAGDMGDVLGVTMRDSAKHPTFQTLCTRGEVSQDADIQDAASQLKATFRRLLN